MKAILVPIANEASYSPVLEADASTAFEEDTHRSVLNAAVLLARQLDGYLEGFALGPNLPDLYGMIEAPPLVSMLDEGWRREATVRSRRLFEEFMRAENVPERFGEPKGLSFGWHGDKLQGDAFLGDYGRAFDLAVVARPVSRGGPRLETVEEALFNTGRPVLVAPLSPPAHIGHKVLIAWNGSTETARAVSFAMPLLVRANRVTVLTVKGGTVPGPSGEDVARTLRINGIPASALHIDPGARPVGEAVLYHAGELDTDLLIKGAYTQSRLRQMIFGGPTRYLLEHATVPMLMAH